MCASSGMIVYRHGMPAVLLALEMLDRQIWETDLIANPDKLQGGLCNSPACCIGTSLQQEKFLARSMSTTGQEYGEIILSELSTNAHPG